MLSIGSSFSSIEKPSVLFLLVGVAITHIVVPDIAAISEKLRTLTHGLKIYSQKVKYYLQVNGLLLM